jgi:hypothetical protein
MRATKPPAATALIGSSSTEGTHDALHKLVGFEELEVHFTSEQASFGFLQHLID